MLGSGKHKLIIMTRVSVLDTILCLNLLACRPGTQCLLKALRKGQTTCPCIQNSSSHLFLHSRMPRKLLPCRKWFGWERLMRLNSNGRTDIALPWRHAVAVLVQASGSPFTLILIHIMNTYIYR